MDSKKYLTLVVLTLIADLWFGNWVDNRIYNYLSFIVVVGLLSNNWSGIYALDNKKILFLAIFGILGGYKLIRIIEDGLNHDPHAFFGGAIVVAVVDFFVGIGGEMKNYNTVISAMIKNLPTRDNQNLPTREDQSGLTKEEEAQIDAKIVHRKPPQASPDEMISRFLEMTSELINKKD